MSESPAPMSMKKRLVISALFGVGFPVLSLIVVSFTDDHSTPTLFRSVAEGAADFAFYPATSFLVPRLLGLTADSDDMIPIVAITLLGVPFVFWTMLVFALSLIWHAAAERLKPGFPVSPRHTP